MPWEQSYLELVAIAVIASIHGFQLTGLERSLKEKLELTSFRYRKYLFRRPQVVEDKRPQQLVGEQGFVIGETSCQLVIF